MSFRRVIEYQTQPLLQENCTVLISKHQSLKVCQAFSFSRLIFLDWTRMSFKQLLANRHPSSLTIWPNVSLGMVTDKTKTKGRARTALGPRPARLINPISHLNAKELNYSDIHKFDASSLWCRCLVVRIARVIVGYHHPVTLRAPCFPTLEAGGDGVAIRSAACYDRVKIEPSES